MSRVLDSIAKIAPLALSALRLLRRGPSKVYRGDGKLNKRQKKHLMRYVRKGTSNVNK